MLLPTFFIFITNAVLGPVLIGDGETGTKGAIASVKENSHLVRETRESAVTV